MVEVVERFGGQSLTADLRVAVVARPGAAFGAAFDDPALGFRHPVDLALAQAEHAAFVELLVRLGVDVRLLDAFAAEVSSDSIYTFDPLLVTDRGAIGLRSGKLKRLPETDVLEAWTSRVGIPTVGRIEAPGTVDGGDTLWLRPDLFCIARSLRTNDDGARQLAVLVGGDVRLFDVPYWRGPGDLVHLLSIISPVAEDLAVVYPPLLPAGLWWLLQDLGIRTIAVPDEEYATLGTNVLAIRPRVCIAVDGNPRTRAALERAGCEVYTYAATEIGINGSGGPTCMTQPIRRG